MRTIYVLIALLMLGAACSEEDSLPVVVPAEEGTWTDAEGNEYGWVRIGDREWMTSNLKTGTAYWRNIYFDDYAEYLTANFSGKKAGYESENRDRDTYGNRYEWEVAREVCEELGDGWRLPTDGDWQDLERALGMGGDAAAEGWRGKGVADLMRQGEEGTKLNLLMGGNVSMANDSWQLKVRYVEEKGFYWTDSTDENGRIYYRMFNYNSSEVYRGTTVPLSVMMMHVRCVRDAQK